MIDFFSKKLILKKKVSRRQLKHGNYLRWRTDDRLISTLKAGLVALYIFLEIWSSIARKRFVFIQGGGADPWSQLDPRMTLRWLNNIVRSHRKN